MLNRSAAIAAALVTAVLAGSAFMWLNASPQSKQADLAANLCAGCLVAIAILILERSMAHASERKASVASLLRYGNSASARQLADASFVNADLRGSQLAGVSLERANLSGARLRDADLRYSILSQARLAGADLRDADLGAADMSGCDLSRTKLKGANLFARPAGGPLHGANLTGTALYGADLRGVALVVKDHAYPDNVVTVDMTRAFANEKTQWPNGFDPEAAGVEVLPGKEEEEHTFNRAWSDPGFTDVTSVTPTSAALVHEADFDQEWTRQDETVRVLHDILEEIQRRRDPLD